VFGEPLAVLTGDALIVLAFEELARAGAAAPSRLGPLVATVARGVGPAQGIVAGQAWESEPAAPIETYHQAKTGALFVAATMGGAVAAGRDPEPWRALGALIGEAYQVADDLLDASAGGEGCGKPVGQDAAFGRPNMAAQIGVEAAMQRLKSIVRRAVSAVPECDGAVELRDLVKTAALRLAPSQAAREAAA
jgi:geranylgeranyl diphosphate synthase type II